MNRAIIGVVFLLSAILSTVPLANAQSTYSWSVSCKRSGGLVGNVVARWNWTSNGVSVQGNIGFCGSGSGTVPPNANGITASLTTEFSTHGGCFRTDSVTKSFTPGTVPSINLKSSCSVVAYGQKDTVSATFTLGPA